MQKSEQQESSIAEEEHINPAYLKKKVELARQQKIKYATVTEIRAFQRSSELNNQKLLENRPLLFGQEDFAALPMRFVSSNEEQSFTLGGNKEDAKDILEVQQDKLTLKLAVSNIRRQNSFILVIKNLKKRAIIQLKNVPTDNERNAVKFKYTLNLNDTSLLIRVFVYLDAQFKVWKEVEVPLLENKFSFEIHQYNYQQTDIKINDFLFHLLLKMPYYDKINYCLIHQGNAEIERIQFNSRAQKREIETKETYCAKECQLI